MATATATPNPIFATGRRHHGTRRGGGGHCRQPRGKRTMQGVGRSTVKILMAQGVANAPKLLISRLTDRVPE